MTMLKDITKEVKAQKANGAFKLRVILLCNIQKDGREIPQVQMVAEFETDHIILKNGQLASWLRRMIDGNSKVATYYKLERLK